MFVVIFSGRLDRKIEFPLPNEDAREHILKIHSRKMNVSSDVNFKELARCTDDFNGAQLKAVCVEAGFSVRRGELFSCPPRTGSSKYPLVFLYFRSLLQQVTVCACTYAYSNSSDTLNANNFRVL